MPTTVTEATRTLQRAITSLPHRAATRLQAAVEPVARRLSIPRLELGIEIHRGPKAASYGVTQLRLEHILSAGTRLELTPEEEQQALENIKRQLDDLEPQPLKRIRPKRYFGRTMPDVTVEYVWRNTPSLFAVSYRYGPRWGAQGHRYLVIGITLTNTAPCEHNSTLRQVPGAFWLGPGRAGPVNVCTRCRLPVTGAMTFEIEMDAFAEPELRETVLTQAELLALKMRRSVAASSHELPPLVVQAYNELPPVGIVYSTSYHSNLIYAQPNRGIFDFFGVTIDHLLVVSDIYNLYDAKVGRLPYDRFRVVVPTDDDTKDRLLVFVFNKKNGSISMESDTYLPVKPVYSE